MKNTVKIIAAFTLALALLCLFSCENANVWETATYTEDTTIGTGAKSATVTVEANNRSVSFKVYTDEDTVADALVALSFISGEEGEFGLYIKTVNGILADYDVNQRYWAFHVNGQLSMVGADSVEFTEGAVYKFVYTR